MTWRLRRGDPNGGPAVRSPGRPSRTCLCSGAQEELRTETQHSRPLPQLAPRDTRWISQELRAAPWGEPSQSKSPLPPCRRSHTATLPVQTPADTSPQRGLLQAQQTEITNTNIHTKYFIDYTKQTFWFIYSSVKTEPNSLKA